MEEKPFALTENFEENIQSVASCFARNGTLILRRMVNRWTPSLRFCLFYTDGMVNNKLVNEDVIRPILEYRFARREDSILDILATRVVLTDGVQQTADPDLILGAILYGDCVILAEGFAQALIVNAKGWATRSVNEPEGEKVIKGPREGFNECLMTNLSLLRRRILSTSLKMEFMNFGRISKTRACLCYVDGIVNLQALEELKRRLQKVDIDATLDVNYLAELIKDAPYSPVKTIGNTERPDVVAGKLLEGRIAIFLDGTPVVLTLPSLFIELFQSDEDYYVNFYFASFGRILRIISFLITIILPAFYLALVTFHQEMIPTPLLESISVSRQGVPFPTVVELPMMLVIFDILREAGARMPDNLGGQALSILGALVIGQAAVQARIVSAPVIIIVAIAGICSMMNLRTKGFMILLRLIYVYAAAILGIYGLLFSFMFTLFHLFGASSFGIPIMSESFNKTPQDYKDIFTRAPWYAMIKRPKMLTPNRVRQTPVDRGDAQ